MKVVWSRTLNKDQYVTVEDVGNRYIIFVTGPDSKKEVSEYWKDTHGEEALQQAIEQARDCVKYCI